MGNETARLAEYAAALRYDDIPADVVERAKHCITDTVAAIVFGHHLPWSRMIVAYAEKNGAGGKSRILGPGGARARGRGGAGQRRAGARLRDGQPDLAQHRRAPGRDLLSSALAVAQSATSAAASWSPPSSSAPR
jgi:2-methylcitrate dehydratase PrpD